MKADSPVFPTPLTLNETYIASSPINGLTIRDHIAIEMAKGLISGSHEYWIHAPCKRIVMDAYCLADALIAESEK